MKNLIQVSKMKFQSKISKILFKIARLTNYDKAIKNSFLNTEEKILLRLQDNEYLKKNNFGRSYLQEKGWLISAAKQEIIDLEGRPLPWITYPAIHFLQDRLFNSLTLFEYGSGNSTLYFSDKVKHVTSVEHDYLWYEKVKKSLPKNVELLFEKLEYDGKYCRKILTTGEKFDIAIVDGRDRVNCCKHSAQALTDQGVVLLDNSNRPAYQEGIKYLLEKGFRKIDFEGMSPKSPQLSCTSIFYRNKNCLGI